MLYTRSLGETIGGLSAARQEHIPGIAESRYERFVRSRMDLIPARMVAEPPQAGRDFAMVNQS
jgi:hypothetical protein